MTIHTISSRELNQDLARAKRAALEGPVFITDRGRPAHVLMSYARYQEMSGQRRNILDALAMPGLSEVDFDPGKAAINARFADLS
ncbi:type II toxin-antitoxin system Phd/YefM family antitoxin [Fuscovulum blasticum]|uniref:type II toxin-antitoxin system Phd/YefM family antitoxin n=1 Tax=Fuscovulum blasticum TaxID=1075 RepID=UPI000D3E48E3|nr:type II toxin-antitoxin system Phd/YefM family antitoxin [Fuscovulum blasticum]AWD23627.1 prevent-host-death protein [Fuscovulum blasticum]